MATIGGLPITRNGHDYLFVVVNRFNEMCILMHCKNTINGQEVTNKFFEQVWVHFGIPRSIISDRDTKFLDAFWTTLWENMDTKLKWSTKFHLQTHGKIEVVNRTLVQLLRGYNQKHPKTLDENTLYNQRSYSRAVCTSTDKSPFKTCFGYFLLSPLDVFFVK